MTARMLLPRSAPWLLGLLAIVLGARELRADEMTREVQEELRKRHLYFGDIDGRFTPEVSAALRRYQERKGFAPSGTPDDTTLRSLTLLPPAAADRSAPPWPDLAVLRSDQRSVSDRREGPVQPGIEVDTAAPPPAPTAPAKLSSLLTPTPAVAATMVPRLDTDAVRAFIERYLQAGQTNDPAAELRFYGEHVDYFDDGMVDRGFIAQDIRRFERRWPDREFALASPVEVMPAPNGDPATVGVRFRYRFKEKGGRLPKGGRTSAAGEAETEYVLAGHRPEDLQIISMKEQRVRP
jgi:peptidoglycan hydrolase-like protein with peptidoglycan-binding domain